MQEVHSSVLMRPRFVHLESVSIPPLKRIHVPAPPSTVQHSDGTSHLGLASRLSEVVALRCNYSAYSVAVVTRSCFAPCQPLCAADARRLLTTSVRCGE